MKKIRLMLLIGVLLLPIVVKAELKYIDINKDMFDSTFIVENNYKEIGLCVGEQKIDNVACIRLVDKEDSDLIDFSDIMYVIMNNTIDFYKYYQYDSNELDDELLDKYEKGELLNIFASLEQNGYDARDIIVECGDECREVEEEDGSNIIKKIYKNDILICEKIINEDNNYSKEVIYDDLGIKLFEHVSEGEKTTETCYKKDGNILLYVKYIGDELSMYSSLGYLNVGDNRIEIIAEGEDDTTQVYHVNINREALVEDTKDDNGNENVIGNDDSNNIKESPNTGSIINLIISIMLIISLITLLYFNRKYNYEK